MKAGCSVRLPYLSNNTNHCHPDARLLMGFWGKWNPRDVHGEVQRHVWNYRKCFCVKKWNVSTLPWGNVTRNPKIHTDHQVQ